MLSVLGRVSASVFLPVRQVAGPLHRRKRALSTEEADREWDVLPLPPPWCDDNRWYRSDFRPSAHNRVEPLPHGDLYFSRLREDLLAARDRVTIAGWALTPLMAVSRPVAEVGTIFAELLCEVSLRADVYILLWAGAPALFEPNTHMAEQARRTLLDVAPRVRCELDRRAKFSHDHHQKAVTVDGRVAYLGGMDISTFQGDRWDTRDHPIRFGPGWHDVQVRLQGDSVDDVEVNFCQRWNACTGDKMKPLPSVCDPGWDVSAQVVRTVPKGFYPEFAPRGEYGIRHALLNAIKSARRFIYLENQYLWAPEIYESLCEAMDRHRGSNFRVVVVLPARAYSGRYDNDRHVRMLRDADPDGRMFEAYSLYAGGPAQGTSGYRYLPIYVHAKVAVIDDEWLLIGSANLNRRGLATDTEIAVQVVSSDVAGSLRVDLWSEHLGIDPEAIRHARPADVIDGVWRFQANRLEQAMKESRPTPPIHVHRYVCRGTPQSRLMDRLQSMTLEH